DPSEFPGSGGESLSTTSLEREERVGKENGVEVNLRQDRVWNSIFTHNRNRLLPVAYHRGSLLPLQWRITHSSHLIAFIRLLVVVFSKNWLYLSKIRLHQRWPMNVSNRISMSARIMSIGLLQICKSKSCSNSETGKVTFIFFTLMLFPINIWIFELNGEFINPHWLGLLHWLGGVCPLSFFFYFNNKNFWSLILSHPSDIMSCSSSSRSDSLNEKIVPNTLVNQEEVLDLEQEKASL
uniref:Uncharacterized protein n=1 Tax=Rhinolophus ferrumequinum TaxID=59479 RepID=A0A671EG11_RHIFE